MTLLALALATDPATPGPVLAAIAADADADVTAYLRVHPNTPDDTWAEPDPAPAYGEPLEVWGEAVAEALTAPWATPATRGRLLRLTSLAVLYEVLWHHGGTWRPDVAAAVIARETQSALWRAYVQMLHPDVAGRDAHAAAIVTLLTAPPESLDLLWRPYGTDLSHVTQAVVAHASTHPAHLPRFAQLCAAPAIRRHLARLADTAARGRDPHQVLINSALHPGTPRRWVRALERTRSAQVADAALAHAVDPLVTKAILTMPELDGTSAAHRAYVHDQTQHLLPVGTPTGPAQLVADLVEHAPDPTSGFAHAVVAHLHLPSHVTRRAWDAVRSDGLTAAARGTLVAGMLHPDLPASDRTAAAGALADPTVARGTHRIWSLAARCAANGCATAVAHATPAELELTAAEDWTATVLLARNLSSALHEHPLTPTGARAAIALWPTFTGTLTELLGTAATLAA